jgi:FlaA1/EpsC-like NDP-sugar epimerase
MQHEYAKQFNTDKTQLKGVLIYGGGASGVSLMREVRTNPTLGWQVHGFLDDNPQKAGQSVMGVPVLGTGTHGTHIVKGLRAKGIQIDQIVIAMPSVTGRERNAVLANCKTMGVPCKALPSMASLLAGKVMVSQIRDVSTEELLGREPVRLDEQVIRGSIEGRAVMVTGGGGSIGSELCRQITAFHPGVLIIFERAESDLFRIHNELLRKFPEVNIVPRIGDIQNYGEVEQALQQFGVSSIFHAAAYKHVPMMEEHLLAAVSNNIFGTRNLVYAAERNGVETFVMISSDKAVNPTNVMGLTKRVAELIASSAVARTGSGASAPAETASGTRFVSVRFGNVLGSNGSVVPMFREQIARGGPVTVTHPEMKRYFMTIAEAVQLVLQASTMGKGSEIFVLDMGEPVPIVTLARDMIRLSGFEPDQDIEIRFTGMRPGEKLFEELLLEGEQIVPTYHEKIKIFRGARRRRTEVHEWLRELETLVTDQDQPGIILHLKDLVPEYEPDKRWREAIAAVPRARGAAAS